MALEGIGRLEPVSWRDGTGAVSSDDIRHAFLMTGAEANTGWLNSHVALDAKGFIIKSAARQKLVANVRSKGSTN